MKAKKMKFRISILNYLMFAALSLMPLHLAYSQTASILPPAKTTFFDKNGNPLAFGTAEFYIPGTTTPKMTWQDSGQTIPNTNPVVLDNAGRGLILGDGFYRQIIRDKNGNLIWDQVTSSTGTGGGGGGTPTVGDGDPVGIVKAWSGFVAPSQYAFAYGQEFARASYPELFQAITYLTNVTCTIGSPTLTSLSDTSQLAIGTVLESSCLNAGATIVSKTTSTVVVSSNAIISTTTTARFFPYGNGDGVNTFTLPDLRGRVIAGRDNMGGIAASVLSSPAGLGKKGGNQTSKLVRSDLPNVSPTFTGNSITATGSIPSAATNPVATSTPGGASTIYGVDAGAGVGFVTNPFTPTGTIQSLNGNVTQTEFSVIQPTQIYNYIIKILPDSNPNTFFGVASIGGMYGIIDCGQGITCSGNTISAVTSVIQYPDAVIYNTSVINALSTDQVIAIERNNPTATTINLPPVAGRDLAPLKIVDWSDPLLSNTITLVPNGSETIFRLPSWTVMSTSSGRAMVTLYPSTSLNGWYLQ